MEQLMLQGNRFSLTIQRKAVKHLILRLKSDSELTVSAPYFCSRRDIDQFILSAKRGLSKERSGSVISVRFSSCPLWGRR